MKRLALVLCIVACGGGQKKGGGDTTTGPTGGGGGEEGGGGDETVTSGENTSMVSAETMDEIQKMFQRKGNAVSHCLAVAVDNKELPKNSHGKVTLDVTISTGGKAERVSIIKASLESKGLHDCIIERVKEIQFPQLPKTYPTTYTYAFEAM